MSTLIALLVVPGVLIGAYLLLRAAVSRRFGGTRLVTCPETGRPAAVELDVAHLTVTAAAGTNELRLATCSRWPARADCGQECLRQIEAAPEDCLVRTILARWYEGKRCALCGKPFGPIASWGHQAALLRVCESIPGPSRAKSAEQHKEQPAGIPEEVFRGVATRRCDGDLKPGDGSGIDSQTLRPAGETAEWGDVRAETLPELLSTHQPVCWNCHVAEAFRRQHPELVIDRPAHVSTHHAADAGARARR